MKHDFLPESFIEKMKELLGDELDSFLACFEETRRAGLRVNSLKLSPEEFEKLSPVRTSRIPWIPNGFYYDEDDRVSLHPYYYAGLYYIQEPSAMTPASLLPVKPGDRVLDICAAPGGKSTELGARLKGRGVLVSNDISNSRAKALLKNVELFGIRNAVVISEAPAKLAGVFNGWFDRILVDAPCSGEGMFRKSHAIIKNWEQYGTGYYAQLQREILPCAVSMLRPGGYLVYSTCTFSPEEDEGTLKFILDNFPDMEVVRAADLDRDCYAGFKNGDPMLVGGPEEISESIRIYPHRVKGEGHFVALLHKRMQEGDDRAEYAGVTEPGRTAYETSDCGEYGEELFTNVYDAQLRKRFKDISDEAFDFLERIRFAIPADRLEVREDRLYLMPADMPQMRGLRIMRSGLLLGEMKKGRFEPSQALACALRAKEYDNVCNISSSSPDVMRYLKCETVDIPDTVADGYVLILCDGYPLGWGKAAGGRLKNRYLPGWRMQ